ncbi:MAG: dTDP-glucose 4,6-dehydratase [Actinomycetes bacterium]
MRLLVTGGAGFIGSNYVRRLLDGTLPGVESVVVLDKLTYAGSLANLAQVQADPRFSFVHGDICDRELLKIILPKVDAIVNFAAESHVDNSINNSDEFVRTNIFGVQILLEEVRRHSGVRFLQVSTDEVYGSIAEGSWSEFEPLLPNSPYAATKAAAEMLVRAFHRTYGTDTVVTRCSNNYGPFHFPEKLIPLFITNLIEGKKVPVYGQGLNVRDWLHVDDHCLGIHLALTKGASGEIYNIGGGRELTNIEITEKILALMGQSETSIEYVEDRLGHDFRYSVDCGKAKRDLGYQPKVEFESGLVSVIDWYQNNQTWWKPLKKR